MDPRQDTYRRQRLAHTDAWRQADSEDFCLRKHVDPATGKHIPLAPGVYPFEET